MVRPGIHYTIFRFKMLFCKIVVHKNIFRPQDILLISYTLTFIPKNLKNVLSLFIKFWLVPEPIVLKYYYKL